MLLYEFLPVEEMLDVAEAIIRVFHRFGDRKHMQRNRMKFLIRELGWDEWRRGSTRCWPKCERRAESPSMEPPRLPRGAGARLDLPPAPSMDAVKRMAASVEVHGPGVMPGTVKLQTFADAYVSWMKTNVRAAAAGRLCPRHRRVCCWAT